VRKAGRGGGVGSGGSAGDTVEERGSGQGVLPLVVQRLRPGGGDAKGGRLVHAHALVLRLLGDDGSAASWWRWWRWWRWRRRRRRGADGGIHDRLDFPLAQCPVVEAHLVNHSLEEPARRPVRKIGPDQGIRRWRRDVPCPGGGPVRLAVDINP